MLTYAVPENIAEALVIRNVERYSTVAEADWQCLGDTVIIYDNDEITMIFPIADLWNHWHTRKQVAKDWQMIDGVMAKWSRRVELYIRLRLKLRARRVRLSHKQHHHSAPTD